MESRILINGYAYDWNNIEIIIPDVLITDITKIDEDHNLQLDKLYEEYKNYSSLMDPKKRTTPEQDIWFEELTDKFFGYDKSSENLILKMSSGEFDKYLEYLYCCTITSPKNRKHNPMSKEEYLQPVKDDPKFHGIKIVIDENFITPEFVILQY